MYVHLSRCTVFCVLLLLTQFQLLKAEDIAIDQVYKGMKRNAQSYSSCKLRFLMRTHEFPRIVDGEKLETAVADHLKKLLKANRKLKLWQDEEFRKERLLEGEMDFRRSMTRELVILSDVLFVADGDRYFVEVTELERNEKLPSSVTQLLEEVQTALSDKATKVIRVTESKEAYDGEKQVALFSSDKGSTASIYPKMTGFTLLKMSPLEFGRMPKGEKASPNSELSLKNFKMRKEKVDDSSRYILERELFRGLFLASKLVTWVRPEMGFSVERYILKSPSGATVIDRRFTDFVKFGDVWFPRESTSTSYDPRDNRLRRQVQFFLKSAEFNIDVPDDTFRIELDEGTHVVDVRFDPPLSYSYDPSIIEKDLFQMYEKKHGKKAKADSLR